MLLQVLAWDAGAADVGAVESFAGAVAGIFNSGAWAQAAAASVASRIRGSIIRMALPFPG
jgi:hypothetical protein